MLPKRNALSKERVFDRRKIEGIVTKRGSCGMFQISRVDIDCSIGKKVSDSICI